MGSDVGNPHAGVCLGIAIRSFRCSWFWFFGWHQMMVGLIFVCVCVCCVVLYETLPRSLRVPTEVPFLQILVFFFWLFFCRLEFIFTIFADSWFFGSWYLTPSACYYTAWGTDLCLHAIHAYPAIPRCSVSSPLHLGFLLNRPVSVVLPSFGSLISSSSSIISTFSIHQ